MPALNARNPSSISWPPGNLPNLQDSPSTPFFSTLYLAYLRSVKDLARAERLQVCSGHEDRPGGLWALTGDRILDLYVLAESRGSLPDFMIRSEMRLFDVADVLQVCRKTNQGDDEASMWLKPGMAVVPTSHCQLLGQSVAIYQLESLLDSGEPVACGYNPEAVVSLGVLF